MFSKINFIEQHKSIFYLATPTTLNHHHLSISIHNIIFISHPSHPLTSNQNLPATPKQLQKILIFWRKFHQKNIKFHIQPVYPFYHEFQPKYEKLNIWDEEKRER